MQPQETVFQLFIEAPCTTPFGTYDNIKCVHINDAKDGIKTNISFLKGYCFYGYIFLIFAYNIDSWLTSDNLTRFSP